MSAISITEAQEQLQLWLTASRLVAEGKSYAIAGRTWTGEDSKEIRENINFWSGMINELTADAAGGRRIRGATPVING